MAFASAHSFSGPFVLAIQEVVAAVGAFGLVSGEAVARQMHFQVFLESTFSYEVRLEILEQDWCVRVKLMVISRVLTSEGGFRGSRSSQEGRTDGV